MSDVGMREVVFRLAPRPAVPLSSLPLVLAEGTRSLVVESTAAHLDERGDVWRILHAYGPPAEVATARRRFDGFDPDFLLEKKVLAETRGRLVLWYKYRARATPSTLSQTALAFRRLGRETVVTDVARAGALTMRVVTRNGRALRAYVREARALADRRYEVSLLHVGPPRDPAAARLGPEEERVLAAACAAGLFDVPRRAGVRDVARTVGLSPSAVSARLRRAEGKLAAAYLGAR